MCAPESYERLARRRKPIRWFYRWLLPLLWVVICRVNFDYPGDEYGMWGVASLAAAWIIPLGGLHGDIRDVLPRVLAAGTMTMLIVGWIMDRVRVPRRWWAVVWLPLAALVCLLALQPYPTYAQAIAKNGSLGTYISSSLNFAMYPSVVLLLIATPLLRLGSARAIPGHCVECDYDLTGNVSGRCPECGRPVRGQPMATE